MTDDKLLILSLGGRQAQALARRIRGCGVYCEIAPAAEAPAYISARRPKGLVIAGAAEDESAPLPAEALSAGLPILGVGEGTLSLLKLLGGHVGAVAASEQMLEVDYDEASPLTRGMGVSDRYMTKLYHIELPEGLKAVARGGGVTVGFASESRAIYGLQFTVEPNDTDGLELLDHFADICGLERWWTTATIVSSLIEDARARVGDGEALMALSGGVDSSVCAALMHRAIGERLHCVYIDTGLMRKGDNTIVRERFAQALGIPLTCVNARERFYERLRGVTDPAGKWVVIGDEFTRIFSDEAARFPKVKYLVQGTIYPDILNYMGDEQDLGGLTGYELIEPVKYLFKDEVRSLGEYLGLDSVITQRQPLPGSGLAMRITGEASLEKLAIVREADAILREEIESAGLQRKLNRWCAQLCDTTSTGEGGCRYVVALRALTRAGSASVAYRMPYDLLEKCAERILKELPPVDRVVYDLTPSPLRAEDWENA